MPNVSKYFDETEVRKTIAILKPEGQLFECRVLCKIPYKVTYSGYFRSADTLLNSLDSIPLANTNIYISLNEINEACYSRQQRDTFVKNPITTSDQNIDRYQWLMIDLDPERPSEVSSTDEELIAACHLGSSIHSYLKALGFPEPVSAKSGNGCHLLYRINLENTPENENLVKRCLAVLSALFSTSEVTVDTSNYNPSRICKLHGTLAQKGADTPERPHRMSRLLSDTAHVQLTSQKLLEKLCEQMPAPEKAHTGTVSRSVSCDHTKFSVVDFMNRHGIGYKQSNTPWNENSTVYSLDECPFHSEHRNGDAKIFEFPDGTIRFKCHHDSCSDKHWRDVRLLFEPDAYSGKSNQFSDSASSSSAPQLTTHPDAEAVADQAEKAAAPANSEAAFNDFTPFSPELEPPEYPVDHMPAVLRIFTRQIAAELEVDPCMVGTSVLAVLSLAAAKKYEVRIRHGWQVPVNLYCLICADSAERKSPVVNAVTAAVYKWQRRENEDIQPLVDRYQTKRAILIHSIESTIKAQKKKLNGREFITFKADEKQDEVNAMKDELRCLEQHPVCYKALILDDVTPEAMSSAMVEQDERVGLFSTEAGSFDMISGRYNAGSTNADLILKAWCGDPYSLKRIGRSGEELKSPALSVLLGCQPSVLKEVMDNPKLRGRGLMARFLYCIPHHVTGSWDGSVPADEDIRLEWEQLIIQLLAMQIPEEPEIITLEAEAIPIAQSFYDDVEGKLRKEYLSIQSWAGKYRDQCFRIAGLLAIAAGHTTISAGTLNDALALGRYYLTCAMIAHNVNAESENAIEDDAREIWKKIDHDCITQRDVQRALRSSRFRKIDDLIPGLQELERRGYIRIEETYPARGGQVTRTIFRNPAVAETA